MERIKSFLACVFTAGMIVAIYFFTSIGRTDSDGSKVTIVEGITLTGNATFTIFCLFVFIVALIGATRSLMAD